MHVYVYSVYINTENMIKIKTIAQLNCSNWNTGNCMGCVFSRKNNSLSYYIDSKISGKECIAEDGCDYFAFHDVDMLPEDDTCDYSYPKDHPVQIATYLSQWDYNLRDVEYFGGCL